MARAAAVRGVAVLSLVGGAQNESVRIMHALSRSLTHQRRASFAVTTADDDSEGNTEGHGDNPHSHLGTALPRDGRWRLSMSGVSLTEVRCGFNNLVVAWPVDRMRELTNRRNGRS